MKVITTHENPDFDAIASCIAAKKLYPDAHIEFPAIPERSTRNFMIQSIIYPYMESCCDPQEIDTLIIVDTRSSRRIENRFKNILNRVKTICYDHHADGDIECAECYLEQTGANVTQMVERLFEKGIPIDEHEATLFLLGIYQDTGKLSYSSTTPRDMMAAAKLLQAGADLDTVRSILEETLTEVEILLLNELIKNKRIFSLQGRRIGLSFASLDEYVGNVAGIVTRFMNMDKLDAAICIFRMASRLYVIGRSNKDVDVSAILKTINGGGHKQAASATLKNKTLIEAVELLSAAIKSHMLTNVKAKDIMSYPPRFVYDDETIADAKEKIARSGINAFVVLKRSTGEIVGIATRQAIDRGHYHKLDNEKVSTITATEFETVDENESLDRIKHLAIDKKQKLIPVTSNGKLTGVITRTSLLKVLSSSTENTANPDFAGNIARDIKRILPVSVVEKLVKAGEVAKRIGCNAYLVGGVVRDIILDIKNLDIDIVVERVKGDQPPATGITFAEEFAKIYNAKVAKHEKFLTATVIFDDGLRMDIATAREEFYDLPGALPNVEDSSLKMDLYRRDFTINTLAVKLHDNFGDLLDFFGGLKDIENRKIRILHVLSFIEDPTRIFRAIRFATKLDFEIGKQTDSKIKEALNNDILKHVTNRLRIFNELSHIFETPCLKCSFELMQKYDIFRRLNPALMIDKRILEHLEKLEASMERYQHLFDKSINRTHAVCLLLEYLFRKRASFIQTIGADEKTARLVKQDMQHIHKARYIVKKESVNNLEIYNALKDLSKEGVLVLHALEPSNKNIEFFMEKLINMKPIIRGKDLLHLGFKPSALFSTIINDVFERQILGEIKEKSEAIDYVKRKYSKEIAQGLSR